MPKWKRWRKEDVKQLRQLAEDGESWESIALKLDRSLDAVQKKARRLGVDVVVQTEKKLQTTTTLTIPKDLPSIEMQLRVLAGAIEELKHGGLDKTDVMRLGRIIAGVKAYKEAFADYVDYRGIEQKVESAIEWLKKLEQERKSVERKKSKTE